MNRWPLVSQVIAKLSNPLRSLTVRNATSSFVALGWLSALSILTIPIYIGLLGIAEWGLVAACVSLQILSNFIDAGFSQIVPRWAAREAQNPARLYAYFLLFQRIYVGLGFLMFVTLQVAADYLAHQWFQVPHQSANALEFAIRIISFQFLFQFINNLYVGIWYGIQRQVLANIMACGFGTLKHVVALFSLHFVSPQAWIYAFAFACVACLEVLVNAINVRRVVSTTDQRSTNNKIPLVPLLKEVSLLSVGILVGLLVSQLDRIVLSRSVDVASFGVYTVIATLALAFLQLQAPITRACFPLIVESVQNGEKLSNVHMKYLLGGTFLTCTLPALLACTVAQTILEIWLNDVSLVSLGATPLKLLLLGIALNSIYGCFYQFIIATGQSHRVLQFNSLSLAVAVVAIYTYGIDNGLLLGAIIWLSTSSTQLLLGIIWWYTTSYRKAQP